MRGSLRGQPGSLPARLSRRGGRRNAAIALIGNMHPTTRRVGGRPME